MTPWGTRLYLEGTSPSMLESMSKRAVPLLLASYPIFIEELRTNNTTGNFRPEDVSAMRNTYLPFWGPYWIAGEAVAANERNSAKAMLVPGPYSLTGAAIEVDGRFVRP